MQLADGTSASGNIDLYSICGMAVRTKLRICRRYCSERVTTTILRRKQNSSNTRFPFLLPCAAFLGKMSLWSLGTLWPLWSPWPVWPWSATRFAWAIPARERGANLAPFNVAEDHCWIKFDFDNVLWGQPRLRRTVRSCCLYWAGLGKPGIPQQFK